MNLELVKDVVSHNDDLILKLSPPMLPILVCLVVSVIILFVVMCRVLAGKVNRIDVGVFVIVVLFAVTLFTSLVHHDTTIGKSIYHSGHSQKVVTYEGYIDKKDIDVKELNTTDSSKEVLYIDNQTIPKNDKDIITTKDINFDVEKVDKVKVIAEVEYAYENGKENLKKHMNLNKSDLKNKPNYIEQLKSVKLEPVK